VLIKIQPDATVCRYLFTAKSPYMFWVSQHPSSRVLKTVTATSGTGHNTGTATSLQRGPVGGKYLYQYYDLYRRLRLQFLVLLMMGAVTPETCIVTLQWINIYILLHLVGFFINIELWCTEPWVKKNDFTCLLLRCSLVTIWHAASIRRVTASFEHCH